MIYMDNAATTRMHPSVLQEMLPFMNDRFGNPSGKYVIAQSAKHRVEEARATIAATINALPEEIYFTSGGTESDNWAVKMVSDECRGGHIITSKIEHKAILETCGYLEKKGVNVTRISPDKDGLISAESVGRNIRRDTCLISVMAANNEVGTIQPIKEIGEIAAKHGVMFHTDAVQAYTNIPIDVKRYNINLMSVSAHKICGPKGVGFLYIEKGMLKTPLISGGGQELGLRSGTENVAGIVGLAKAAQIAYDNMAVRTMKEVKMRDYMISRILNEIEDTRLNGHTKERLPNNINVSFIDANGAKLIYMLDKQGICASAGSACSSASATVSHVLTAIGLEDDVARGTVRFSINEKTTKREIDYVVSCLKQNVNILRNVK